MQHGSNLHLGEVVRSRVCEFIKGEEGMPAAFMCQSVEESADLIHVLGT